ncbi:CBN-FIG-1 protein, partial [Caenorhabditis brenneri]
VRPKSMGAGAYYDGMVVINHYKDRSTSCRKATIDCMTTMDYETAELYLDNTRISSSEEVEVDLQCSNQGVWMYNGQQYSTASCLVSNTTSSSGKKRRKRQAGTGVSACQSCSALPMTSLYAFYPYMNGFSTISIEESGSCMTAVAACEGVTSTDSVAWIASGTILSSGTYMVNMTFTCNSLSSWQTSSGSVFSSLSCGRQYATTTVATTTVASQALNCPNLIAAPLTSSELGPNESNGQLILDHFIDTTAMAREVTITCYGSSSTDNTTISFNGGSRTMSGTGQIELTMTCSSSGQWMRNGIGVQTVACIVITPPGSTVPITTTIPTTPTTSAGSLPSTNCARNVMLTIPNGYNAGYLSMNTISTETSLQLVMSCAAPTGITESMLLSSTGAISTTGTPTTNMTMTCNSASQWVVSSTSGTGIPVGTVITSIACVVAVSPTTTLVPATIPSGCQLCPNLPAIGLLSSQLDSNERNGQFILDHVTTPTACRVVYLSCAGSSASENSTILFNGGAQTMSNQGITSTVLTCTSASTWDWYGSSIGYASCKVADRALTTTTAPLSLTTTAYVVPGDTGLACSRSSLVNPLIEGDAGAYLVLDTIIVNGGLSTTISCSAPDDSSTAVLTNGDGSVLGQSSTGLINMTLTCNSNSQWVITAISASTSGTSSVLGTVVDDLKCGEIPAATTTTPTTTTPTTTTTTIPTTTTSSGACQLCPNMQAIALTSSQLVVNGATNGQLLLSHSVDQSSKCRIVVIKCRGENATNCFQTNQNATIFFNANGQSLSAMYGQVATSMACSPSNTWQRNGVEIDGVACMITSVVGATSTSPAPITTVAPTPTTQSSNGPSASCNSAFATAVSTPGYTSGFMTVDTKTSGSVMTASITCASPGTTQTAVLLDSNNNQVSYGVGSTFMTLTCNSNSQWVTPTGTVITTLGCATVAPATTTTTIATTVPTPAATTTITLAAGDCSAAAWNAWQEWSSCTDTCGSCGTQQRFRSCNKPLDTCTCTGSAYEKNYCNLASGKTIFCEFSPNSLVQCISLGCLGGFGGCGSACLFGLCLQPPISHDRGDNDLSIAHLQCVHFFNDIKSCFMEHANSEYFEGFNEDTQHENEETSLASSF